MGDSLVKLLMIGILFVIIFFAIVFGVMYLFKIIFKVWDHPKYGLYIILALVAAFLFLGISLI